MSGKSHMGVKFKLNNVKPVMMNYDILFRSLFILIDNFFTSVHSLLIELLNIIFFLNKTHERIYIGVHLYMTIYNPCYPYIIYTVEHCDHIDINKSIKLFALDIYTLIMHWIWSMIIMHEFNCRLCHGWDRVIKTSGWSPAVHSWL